MKSKFFKFSMFVLAVFLIAFSAMAQDASVVSNADFFSALVKSVSLLAVSKPKVLVIVAAVVQLLVMLLKTPMTGNWFTGKKGIVKMAVIAVLVLSGMVIDAVVNGGSVLSVISSTVFLTTVMNYVNEIIKHLKEAKESSPQVAQG